MNKKIILKAIILLLMIVTIVTIASFTSKTGDESNQASQWLAKKIENFIGSHFKINRCDTFWKVTLNAILRKIGHFVEFAWLGAISCVFFVLSIKRKWISVILSIGLCVLIALTDEFRQMFIAGRTPQWFDVKIDIIGSLCGVFISYIVYLIYSKMRKLQARIEELESKH